MVEVECPLCNETVDLGSDSPGEYECPYCGGIFEYESQINYDAKSKEIVQQIESSQLDPDYLIHRSDWTHEWYWKIINLIIFIPFILLIIGIFLVIQELKGGIVTEKYVYSTVYNSEYDLVIYYETINGRIDSVDWFALTDKTIVQFSSMGGEYPTNMLHMSCESSSGSPYGPVGTLVYSEWKDFCEYRGIDFRG